MTNDFDRFNEMADLNSMSASSQEGTVLLLDPSQVRVVEQVRTEFNGIEELAESMLIEQQSPIIVSPLDKNTNTYLLQKGERRWRAAVLIGNGYKLKAIVDSTPRSRAQAIASQMRENIQREDFLPLETARGLLKLRAEMKAEGKKGSGRELAAEMGKPESWISKHLDLAEIPEPLAKLCNEKKANDADLIQALKKIYEIDQVLGMTLIDQARSEQGLSRAEAREALKSVRGGSSTPTSQEDAQQSRSGETAEVNRSGIPANEAGGAGAASQGTSDEGAQTLANDTSAQQTSTAAGVAQKENTQPPAPKGGEPTPKATLKKLGKNETIEIDARQMVMQVRVSTDKKQFNGELLLNVLCGSPNKGVVSYLDGGKQHKGLFDLEAIEIISLAKLEQGD